MKEGTYLEQKAEKGEMKRRLRDWGQTMERLAWKKDELEKLRQFYELQKKVWDGDEDEKSRKMLEKKKREYEGEVRRIRLEMEEMLQEKGRIDGMLQRLTAEEEMFVRMRFEKGYGFDYMGMKLHQSRATLFRLQDRVLEKLILWGK